MPDPLGIELEEGQTAFQTWFELLAVLLGHVTQLLTTIRAIGCGYAATNTLESCQSEVQLEDLPYFVFFSHAGQFYPVLGFTVNPDQNREDTYGTFFLIIDRLKTINGDWQNEVYGGLDAIEAINNGEIIWEVLFYIQDSEQIPLKDDIIKGLAEIPSNWYLIWHDD